MVIIHKTVILITVINKLHI